MYILKSCPASRNIMFTIKVKLIFLCILEKECVRAEKLQYIFSYWGNFFFSLFLVLVFLEENLLFILFFLFYKLYLNGKQELITAY